MLARGRLEDVDDALLRTTGRNTVSDECAVKRGLKIVDGIMHAVFGQEFGVQQQPLARTGARAVTDIELHVIGSGIGFEVEDLPAPDLRTTNPGTCRIKSLHARQEFFASGDAG